MENAKNNPVAKMRKVGNNFYTTLFVSLFITVNGCQAPFVQAAKHNKVVIVEAPERAHHAKEILKGKYKELKVGSFEKDKKLSAYLHQFLANENVGLDKMRLVESVFKNSREHGYDPVFLVAVMKTESQFNPYAIGSAGEIGLMQIKPSTAEWICKKAKIKWLGKEALKDPAYNVKVGSLYFKYLKKSLKSKSNYYISAYNTGISNLNRLPASKKEQHPYYTRVLENYSKIYQELYKIKSENTKS